MTRMPRQKRLEVAKVVVGGIGFCLLLSSLIWNTRYSTLAHELETVVLHKQIELAERGLNNMDSIRRDARIGKEKLEALKSTMAEGDLYLWVMNALRPLAEEHDILIEKFDTPALQEPAYAPVLPYRQAKFVVKGFAHFHDIGSFTAGLENRFPFLRVDHLTIDATPDKFSGEDDSETLWFEMEFVTTVSSKPIDLKTKADK